MPGIGVITNPRSKQNRRAPERMKQLGYLLGTRGSAEATRTLDDLYRAAEVFKAEGIDVLGINGGDGTIHVTLTAFVKVYGDTPLPKVAILRGGTMNTVARGLGIKGDGQKILFEVIDRYHQGEPLPTVRRNLMQVGDTYGFIFGNGIVANFLEAYYETGMPGPSVAARMVARAVVGAIFRTRFTKRLFRRFHGRVTADGERWAREDFVTVVASTVPQIGLGFTPFYRSGEKPDHFAVLGIHTSPLGMVLELPRIYRARSMRRDKRIDEIARELVLESDEPWGYSVDGDMFTAPAGALRIRTGPPVDLIKLDP